jgi:hypothetical protein
MTATSKLGIITTGHGPRPEYLAYHTNAMRLLGVPVEVHMRHSLEELDGEAIDQMAPVGGEVAIGCHVRAEGRQGDRMGPGYREVLVSRTALIPLVQRRIRELEDVDGVDAIIYCCAEEYPDDAFRSTRPLIMPFRTAFGHVEGLVRGLQRTVNLGLVVPGQAWIPQDRRTWSSRPWMRSLNVIIEPLREDPPGLQGRYIDRSAATVGRQLLQQQSSIDLVVVWGYGAGLAPFDPGDIIETLAETVQAPVMTIHSAATLAARSFLQPPLRDRDFALPKAVGLKQSA